MFDMMSNAEWLKACDEYFSGSKGDSVQNKTQLALKNAKAFQVLYTYNDLNGNPRKLICIYDEYFDMVQMYQESSAGGGVLNYLRHNCTEMMTIFISSSEFNRMRTLHKAEVAPIV